ncbi:MAG: prepilin peptidase, partial [Lachnospiraceae bacterium]|nr:prepilin peptidase [Lachnospiraceae bacterium]
MMNIEQLGWIGTGLLGLVFGSFLNCAAMRIARGEDFVHGRSRCRACGHPLGGRDLVPLASWVLSKGRCRYCHAKVSVRYPLSELIFAGL